MELLNHCTKIPVRTLTHIKNALPWIDTRDIKGIHTIRLLENLPKPVESSPQWYSDAAEKGYGLLGWYSAKTSSTSANITLYIPAIYRSLPTIYLFSPVPTLVLTRIIAHEVAHHLMASRGYIFKRGEYIKDEKAEEKLAESYAFG